MISWANILPGAKIMKNKVQYSCSILHISRCHLEACTPGVYGPLNDKEGLLRAAHALLRFHCLERFNLLPSTFPISGRPFAQTGSEDIFT